MITQEKFWMMADETRLEAEYLADEQLTYLQEASLEKLQKIFLQYRYFTKQYPNNLGVLIAKTPPGNFKSLIAEILSEELGNGKFGDSHLTLWDNFLCSLRIAPEVLETSANQDNAVLLEERWRLT
ncbi:MAG: iron-containing redox enzyme family protein, partial [Microcystaceae cyanobacterium]